MGAAASGMGAAEIASLALIMEPLETPSLELRSSISAMKSFTCIPSMAGIGIGIIALLELELSLLESRLSGTTSGTIPLLRDELTIESSIGSPKPMTSSSKAATIPLALVKTNS
jgi:hypothetical protein